MRHTRIGLMVDGNVCTGEEMLFLKTGFMCCFCYEKCRQISLNAQRQCTESCSVAMRSYPGNDFESRRQNEALLHVEFPVVMKLPIFIKGKVRLQSSELLQKSVYPNSKRIPMWQTGITGVGALLLTFVSLIYYGNCIHDIKRDALIEDSFNLRRASIRQHAQQSFKYRNEDLNNFLDVSIRSKNQNSEKLMLADGCVYQQLPNMQPRAKLCCHPVVSSSSSGQTKVDNIGSRSLLLESSSVRSSSGPVLPSNSEAVLPPVNHVPMYPPESSLSYNLHPPNMLQPSSASTVFQSPHMPLLSLPFAVQPSPPLVQSAVYPSPPVSLPDISPEVQEILNSPLPSLHPSMPQKVSTVVQLDAMPPISQPSKQSNDRLGSFQAYAPFTTPSSFVSPAFLPKDLPKILTNPTHAESVPRINSLVRSPYQSPSQPRSSLSFLPFPPSPVTTQRSTPVHAAASLHAPGRSKLLVPPMQSGQYPEHLPIGRVTPALAPIEPLEMVAPPLVQAYNTPSPKPSSQSLQPPKRPHFEKIMPALAPSWPLPVTVPPLVPFNNRRSPQPSSQSFVSPVKQSSATVVPPLSAQSLPIFSPSVPHSQGSSGYKFHPPEVVSSIMAGRSLPPTLAHPVTIPPSVSFHGQRHQPRHSVLHPVVPDASNSFPKHLTPMLFNDPSPALLPVVHSRASFSPTVHGNIVPASLKKRQRSPLGTTPTTPPTTVPASLSIHGSVPSPQSLDPPSAPRKRSGRLAPIALAPTIQENVSSPENSVPSSPRKKRSRRHAGVAMAPMSRGSVSSPPINFPSESPMGSLGKPLLAPTLIFPFPSHHHGGQGSIAASPSIVSSDPHRKKPRKPLATSPMKFPPPPPDQDCTAMTCIEPLTSTPLGSPCGCVLPMQVELELGVAPYAFFPLVSELAAEISAGTYLKQSQVRIMGANADGQDQEKTFVNIDLVPLGEKFDMTTALLTWDRFWQKKMIINATFFGDYRVIFIRYPGLPASPPSSNATLGSPSGVPGRLEPFGVEVKKRSEKMGGGTIAVVALSSAVAMVICLGAIWLILLKCSKHSMPALAVAPTLTSSVTKRSGGGSILSSSMASSTSLSFASSMATYMGSAKTFTLAELEKATDRFNDRNILGEGGFGRVYRGVLDDGTLLAVKILTRDDQQGGREFIAEIEMLSRLHHRNLVKLIGICTEEHNRCLVYELIPNGSVESHLHGHDKVTAPLDWDARMKIALGAARGLAYLHEDSNPRVIHRDFKASNILLEDDFTPKVSDFGLAKAASDEGSGHISTRVMGTFGYVAPEYAMTGHLLVKSDVYSYGVVLLELLSGRKPVDMSQPPGQENLVTWARPLLTTKEGLELLVDPALGGAFTFDNMARVAAIASMCVQPEVSHRPFMGEVVQALKLVYNDSDTSNGGGSGIYSQGDSPSPDNELNEDSGSTWWPSTQYIPHSTSFVTIDYDSGPLQTQVLETERPLSASALLSSSGRFMRQPSGSFRRHSSSGPLRTLRSKPSWYRVWGLTGGSMSEHGLTNHFGSGLDREVHDLWP